MDGFTHKVGAHCESTALRDVFEHLGFSFSEEMLFGLDGTFGFIYWKRKDSIPPLGVGGKVAMFPHKLPSLLGFNVKEGTTTSQKRAWNHVKELIDRDIPVILHADMAFLDYMRIPKNGEHFGAHTIVLAGYDLEEYKPSPLKTSRKPEVQHSSRSHPGTCGSSSPCHKNSNH